MPQSGFDAVSSIGLTEHIGVANYPAYFQFLKSKLRTGALLLNHCITRPNNRTRPSAGGFIDRYVFPDGELTGSGRIITEAQDVGWEVVHEENLRHHYALTLRDWCRNLVDHWDDAVEEVGLPTAKVWPTWPGRGWASRRMSRSSFTSVGGQARLPRKLPRSSAAAVVDALGRATSFPPQMLAKAMDPPFVARAGASCALRQRPVDPGPTSGSAAAGAAARATADSAISAALQAPCGSPSPFWPFRRGRDPLGCQLSRAGPRGWSMVAFRARR